MKIKSANSTYLFYPLMIFSLTLIIYIIFAGRLNFEFLTHPTNYFNYLSYSFLNKRLDLINPIWNSDLSPFNGKIYMYWGPPPVILILPFISLFGLNFSDTLYTAIISSFAPLIFYFILEELDKLGLTNISNYKKLILTFFLAFGTSAFILSVNGGVWFTSQAISILYIFIAILFLLKFKRIKRLIFMIMATIFLDLAIWSRTSLIFYLPFFLINILTVKNLKTSLLLFLLIGLFFFISYSTYNYLRFGDILETGFSFNQGVREVKENGSKYGVINQKFIPRNLYYMFLNFPRLNSDFPYLQFDYWGNSIFSTSPLFLILIIILKKKYWQKPLLLFNGSTILSIIATISLLLVYFNTGYLQFGSRYLMDIVPLLLILLAQVAHDINIKIILLLFFISIGINTLGVLWFLNLL